MHRRTRGLLAGIILLAATIGLPVAVAATIGDPLHAWTSIHARQASDIGVMAILAIVFYLAWASFVIPVAVEIVVTVTAWITHRPRREFRLPLLGAQQDLARTLISAVLLLLPSVAASVSTASVSSHAQPVTATLSAHSRPLHLATNGYEVGGQKSSVAPVSSDHHPAARDRTYVIPETGGMRSYWALAEHYLGDGQRWEEIWHLNSGRVHADGTAMDTPRRLAGGWTILIPPAHVHAPNRSGPSTREVAVKPGDTLSGIASTNGIEQWQQLWRDNAGRHEPDGQRFDDPDLILPGWTISLPDAVGLKVDGDRPVVPHSNPPSDSRRAGPESPSASRSTGSERTPSAAKGLPTPVLPKPTNTQLGPSRSTTSNEESKRSSQTVNPLPAPLEVGLGALAALVVLDRARRIALRRRRRGHRLAPLPPMLQQVEAQLRRHARQRHPTIAAVQLAAALTAPQRVAIRAVIARNDGTVDLLIDGAPSDPAPPPFVDLGDTWRLPADAVGFAYAAEETDDPFPALAPVGQILDDSVLIDLGAVGPVSVAGDPDNVGRYLTSLVGALAGAPWADRLQIHVPAPIADRLGPLDRVIAENASRPATEIVSRLVSSSHSDPGTMADTEWTEWCTTPIHLYCGWKAEDDVAELLQLAADPRSEVLAVINGPHPKTTIWTLDGSQLTVPTLDAQVTIDLGTEAPAAADLIDFTATAPDVPLGDPRLPDLAAEAPSAAGPTVLQLNILGPVELRGVETPRRSQTLNLLAYLALHRRGVGRDQIVTALWSGQVVSGKTMRNRITEARALVGGAITDGPLWRLSESVTTDWQRFTALAAGDPTEQNNALDLVRGRPFAGLDGTDWIDLDGFRAEIEAAIVDLAITVAEREFASGDYTAAFNAARAGLVASRYEERLHRLAIRAADAEGSNGKVRSQQGEMRTALDIDIEPDDHIQPETLAVYEELLARRSVSTDAGP
jgi:DNA-binding SARP family transcriptional activator